MSLSVPTASLVLSIVIILILSHSYMYFQISFRATYNMRYFFNRMDVAIARGVFPVEVDEEPVILGRGDLLGIEENSVSRHHAELRSISGGLILKCIHRYSIS